MSNEFLKEKGKMCVALLAQFSMAYVQLLEAFREATFANAMFRVRTPQPVEAIV